MLARGLGEGVAIFSLNICHADFADAGQLGGVEGVIRREGVSRELSPGVLGLDVSGVLSEIVAGVESPGGIDGDGLFESSGGFSGSTGDFFFLRWFDTIIDQ